jgi:LCP family protein required for cell wall assembly
VNFLLLGVDQRCDESGPAHTDSILVATVDPLTMSAAVLSLPRDLWVEIPGFGVDRINQAFYFGQVYEYPGGGQALAMRTIEGILGVPINYYITIDFQGFVDAINLLGGIVVDVPEAIDDPDYPDNCYGYEPFSIQPGRQRLDGTTALKYARTRATLGGDVDRAGRQQAVILAVREQLLQPERLPQLILQAPQLWRSFQQNVHTNLALEDTVQLALLAQDIPRENISLEVLDYDYVYIETTPDGRQVLVPRRDQIRLMRDRLFAAPVVPTPVIENLAQLMEEEDARVAVYNGTPVFGLAADTQSFLEELGVQVSTIGNAESAAYTTSQIIDFGSHPRTVQFLVQEMGIPPLNIRSEQETDNGYEVMLIIGSDWAESLENR